eukprot:444876-Rhodomonas_salina.2
MSAWRVQQRARVSTAEAKASACTARATWLMSTKDDEAMGRRVGSLGRVWARRFKRGAGFTAGMRRRREHGWCRTGGKGRGGMKGDEEEEERGAARGRRARVREEARRWRRSVCYT